MKVIIVKPCYVEGKPAAYGEEVETKKGQLLIGMKKAVLPEDFEGKVTTLESAEEEPGEFGGPNFDDDQDDESEQEDDEVDLLVSDSVRDLAIKNNVDLSQVEGTGQHGRILKKDVMAVIDTRDSETESVTTR